MVAALTEAIKEKMVESENRIPLPASSKNLDFAPHQRCRRIVINAYYVKISEKVTILGFKNKGRGVARIVIIIIVPHFQHFSKYVKGPEQASR